MFKNFRAAELKIDDVAPTCTEGDIQAINEHAKVMFDYFSHTAE